MAPGYLSHLALTRNRPHLYSHPSLSLAILFPRQCGAELQILWLSSLRQVAVSFYFTDKKLSMFHLLFVWRSPMFDSRYFLRLSFHILTVFIIERSLSSSCAISGSFLTTITSKSTIQKETESHVSLALLRQGGGWALVVFFPFYREDSRDPGHHSLS